MTIATLPENIPRNRFKDVVPYDENRVKITNDKDNKFGYVNASHISATVGSSQVSGKTQESFYIDLLTSEVLYRGPGSAAQHCPQLLVDGPGV